MIIIIHVLNNIFSVLDINGSCRQIIGERENICLNRIRTGRTTLHEWYVKGPRFESGPRQIFSCSSIIFLREPLIS